MHNIKFLNQSDSDRGAVELTAMNFEQAVTQNLLIQQFYPAISRKVDHMVFTLSEVTTDDALRSNRGIYTKALFPKLLHFMSTEGLTPASDHYDMPDLRQLWLMHDDLNNRLNNKIVSESHLESIFSALIDSFQTLFMPTLGIMPTTAGVLHCLQFELNALKLKFASKIASPFKHELTMQAVNLYFEANRHYPCICFIPESVHHFQRIRSNDVLRSSTALHAIFEAFTLMANFLAGIPHIIRLNELADRFKALSQDSQRILTRIVPFRSKTAGDDFSVLTLMVIDR
jgi:hypothetical protein